MRVRIFLSIFAAYFYAVSAYSACVKPLAPLMNLWLYFAICRIDARVNGLRGLWVARSVNVPSFCEAAIACLPRIVQCSDLSQVVRGQFQSL